ncbi:hypothetical protein Godav_017662 [Gossypium davidsonii]|uniref:Uncharacterized protein n=3 Tax=Gossypium TaxID=3633 RepID=A0A7J8QU42_GOSDV|nr:hypothetical protein [Gossypium davidsonii]MBA0639934.1 hypothetical protein [Gossypium klotzschianum]
MKDRNNFLLGKIEFLFPLAVKEGFLEHVSQPQIPPPSSQVSSSKRPTPLTFSFLSKTPNSSHFRKGNSIRMETGKAFADHNQSYNTEQNSTERSISSTQDSTKFHLSKALARRAVYGSSSRRGTGNRKVRGNDARALPGRLSKVSLAEDEDSEN